MRGNGSRHEVVGPVDPPMIDTRDARRAIAGLLLATGAPVPAELEHASDRLRAMGWPPLDPGDLVRETPESLAPRIPRALHGDVLSLLHELAGGEPIRPRIADAYAGLLHGAPLAPAPPRAGSRATLTRWLIGSLPHHQVGGTSQENAMIERGTPYRGGEVAAPPPAAERTPLRRRVERIQGEFHRVIAAVEQVIVGKRDVIERVLIAMAARGHVLLVDAPGVGKTQLCKAIACAIATRFGRIQFTPDLLPLDITGANVFDVRDKQFHFRPGPIFTHILLADEINRATPKTQSALLEVMEERGATVDGTTHAVGEPFSVLATMNPLDHQGTYALPAAQIDRFMMMLEIGYPTADAEVRAPDSHLAGSPLADVTPVISRSEFLAWCDTVQLIHVSPELKRVA